MDKEEIKSEEPEKNDEFINEDKEPDLTLNVPLLKAGNVNMDAENLNFSISVKAQLSNLTNVEIGTSIHIDKLKLDINSLEAEALFQVKLKKIEKIILKALDSLDKNSELKNTKIIGPEIESDISNNNKEDQDKM